MGATATDERTDRDNRAGLRWSEAEIACLWRWHVMGIDAAVIAGRLDRSPAAVDGKLHRLLCGREQGEKSLPAWAWDARSGAWSEQLPTEPLTPDAPGSDDSCWARADRGQCRFVNHPTASDPRGDDERRRVRFSGPQFADLARRLDAVEAEQRAARQGLDRLEDLLYAALAALVLAERLNVDAVASGFATDAGERLRTQAEAMARDLAAQRLRA